MSFALVGSGNAPTSGGASATISGLSFAPINMTPTAAMAEADCSTTSWASGTTVLCLQSLPVNAGSSRTTVTVASVAGTALSLFTFDGMSPRFTHCLCILCFTCVREAPAVSVNHVGSGNAPGTGGASATISGLSFATADMTPTAMLAESDCSTTSWASGTTVVCRQAAPSNAGSSQTTVTVSSVSGTSHGLFTFDGSDQRHS